MTILVCLISYIFVGAVIVLLYRVGCSKKREVGHLLTLAIFWPLVISVYVIIGILLILLYVCALEI